MKVLVIEDDLSLSDVLAFTLRRAGYQVVTSFDGLAGLEKFQSEDPDLIVLDLNLPKLDGLALCRRIRQIADTPIIILSVRDSDDTIVQGLEMGADDYVVKPFSPNQLLARIKAVSRRSGLAETLGPLELPNLVFDRSRNEIQRSHDEPQRLTPLEAKLLETLMINAGQVLSSDKLISAVWGPGAGDRMMLKQLVYRLRSKIDPPPPAESLIETVSGIGYSLRSDS